MRLDGGTDNLGLVGSLLLRKGRVGPVEPRIVQAKVPSPHGGGNPSEPDREPDPDWPPE